MDESQEKIIVFDSYDTVMAANLVKTKLDAYGIPCFLTDEHFVGLYPIRNEVFSGVRLHIFEKDGERVNEILTEENEFEIETSLCPQCGSSNIELIPEKENPLTDVISSVLRGLFLNPKKAHRCLACSNEFDATPG